jgi:hypothetical protein
VSSPKPIPERVPRGPLLIGVACWCAIAAASAIAIARLPATERERASDAVADLARIASRGTIDREVLFAQAYPWLDAGDGLYRREGFELLRCGQVLAVWDSAEGRRIRVAFDPALEDALTAAPTLTAFSSGASIAWTFRSLLPEHVQARITSEWSSFLSANEPRLKTIVIPLAKDLLREAGPLLLDEFAAAFTRHRDDVDRIAARYREEIVVPQLLPLIEQELWPRFAESGAPTLEALGKDLWSELPLLGLAWQGVKQEFDFSTEDRVNQRFREFVKQDAIPVLQSHGPALQDALVSILRDTAGDPEVSATVRDSVRVLLADAELRQLLFRMFDEVIRSERLRGWVATRLADESAATTLAELRKELDEVFRRIGKKIVFANEETYEVQPDFARFLRTLVLKKDRRWILFESGVGAPVSPESTLLGVVAPE